MDSISYNIILNGADFQEIKYLGRILYFSSKKEKYSISLMLKPVSNISNYNLTTALIKIGKFANTNCSNNAINAIISMDYQSTVNYLPYCNAGTLIVADYSKFNACNYFLADNNSVDKKIREKTENIFKIPVDKIINIDIIRGDKGSPYIALIGAMTAQSDLFDLDSIASIIADMSKNELEKKNGIKALIAGYDFMQK